MSRSKQHDRNRRAIQVPTGFAKGSKGKGNPHPAAAASRQAQADQCRKMPSTASLEFIVELLAEAHGGIVHDMYDDQGMRQTYEEAHQNDATHIAILKAFPGTRT